MTPLTEYTHSCVCCVGNILVRILLTALEKALLLPRWQRMDYQTSFSMLYSIIPDWMLNQYGKHPATVSPTAAFVMLDVGPSLSIAWYLAWSCEQLQPTAETHVCMTWHAIQVRSILDPADYFLCFETVHLLALQTNCCYTSKKGFYDMGHICFDPWPLPITVTTK